MRTVAALTEQMSPLRRQLVDAVKRHAIDHYEESPGGGIDGSWSVLIEATTDAQIAAITGKTCTEKAAIARARAYLRMDKTALASLPDDFYEH
jgi:hypothetical protein